MAQGPIKSNFFPQFDVFLFGKGGGGRRRRRVNSADNRCTSVDINLIIYIYLLLLLQLVSSCMYIYGLLNFLPKSGKLSSD